MPAWTPTGGAHTWRALHGLPAHTYIAGRAWNLPRVTLPVQLLTVGSIVDARQSSARCPLRAPRRVADGQTYSAAVTDASGRRRRLSAAQPHAAVAVGRRPAGCRLPRASCQPPTPAPRLGWPALLYAVLQPPALRLHAARTALPSRERAVAAAVAVMPSTVGRGARRPGAARSSRAEGR